MILIDLVGGSTSPDYVQRTALDGRQFALRVKWNGRGGIWYLHIADQNDEPIASGLALVRGKDLLARVVGARRPPGKLYLVNQAGDADPTFENLGTDCILVYMDEETESVAELPTTVSDMEFGTPVNIASNVGGASPSGEIRLGSLTGFSDGSYFVKLLSTVTESYEVLLISGTSTSPYNRLVLVSPAIGVYTAGSANVAPQIIP